MQPGNALPPEGKLRRLILLALVSWWFIPLAWTVCLPIAWLVQGDWEGQVEMARAFTASFFDSKPTPTGAG